MGKEHLNSTRAPRVQVVNAITTLRSDRSVYPQLTGELRDKEIALQNTEPEAYVHTGFELGAL